MSYEAVMKALDGIEARLTEFDKKAQGESETVGKVSSDTKAALEGISLKQREFADKLMALEQRGLIRKEDDGTGVNSWGDLFVKSDGYKSFASGSLQKTRLEILKNTITNTVGNTFSDRKQEFVGGAFRNLTLESLLVTLPASSGTMDYVKENVFTNNAAEVAEGNAKAESSITTTAVSVPLPTVAHWVKVSKQLVQDNAQLSAYIDLRMAYGVNLRVENQIIAGDGTGANMSGFTKSGNYTAHGYTDAALVALGLTANSKSIGMIRKIIADCQASDYPADAILLNPADWGNLEIKVDTTGQFILGSPASARAPGMWGLPVIPSNAITADNVLVLSLRESGTFYNRDGVTIEMSDSDSDNFTKNLITVRAERRCGIAVERPAAIRYGDLTPA